MKTPPAKLDPLLEPLLAAAGDELADDLLSRLISVHAEPVIKGIINLLYYLLTRQNGLTLWRNEKGKLVAGFACGKDKRKQRARTDSDNCQMKTDCGLKSNRSKPINSQASTIWHGQTNILKRRSEHGRQRVRLPVRFGV